MFKRKKRAPEPLPSCDLCDNSATHIYGINDGARTWRRCDEHQFTRRDWIAITELNAVRGGYERRGA